MFDKYSVFHIKYGNGIVVNIDEWTLKDRKIFVYFEDYPNQEFAFSFPEEFNENGLQTEDNNLLSLILEENLVKFYVPDHYLYRKKIDEIVKKDFINLITSPPGINIYDADAPKYDFSWKSDGVFFSAFCRSLGTNKLRTIISFIKEKDVQPFLSYDKFQVLKAIIKYADISAEQFPAIYNLIHTSYLFLQNSSNLNPKVVPEEKSEKARRHAEKMEKQKLFAIERLTERKKVKSEWRQNHSSERESVRQMVSSYPLEQKLRIICEKESFMPGYYGINYDAITDEELKELSDELLQSISKAYTTIHDKNWQTFRKRVKSILCYKTNYADSDLS